MFMTENSYQVFIPAVWDHGSFLDAIYEVIICNFVRNANGLQYISQMSAIDVYN